MKQNNERGHWLLLIHQLPAEPAYLRVKVGCRLLRVGAVALKNSVYLLPANDPCREDFSWIRREIVDEGGDASLFEASAVEGLKNGDIERLFREARAKEYDELAGELVALNTGAKLDKPQARQAALVPLARLDEQLSALERIDFFPSGAAEHLREQITKTRTSVEQRTGARAVELGSTMLRVADYQGRTWVTGLGVKVDRVACAWLILRFIDKSPKFKFVDPAGYVRRGQELRFDMPEAEFTHESDLCSFEVLCHRFSLSDPALVRLGQIVHDLDIKDGRYLHPETAGVRAFIDGMAAQHARDEARIEAAATLFDALLRAGSSVAPARSQRGAKERRQGMDEAKLGRRDLLLTLALVAGCGGMRSTAPPTRASGSQEENPPSTKESSAMEPKALSADHVVKPLPFDPAKLNGLSERMLRSHHENNYTGAVKNLNRVEQELAGISKDTPPFLVTALRERELAFRGSKLLHEQYFGNLGGAGKRAGEIDRALAAAYGSVERWEEHFRATGAGLGGGSGWVVLGYELDTGGLRTIGAANHTQSLALFVPLLVMDMYEHAYQMDYGAAAAKYIDAFFLNVHWEEVARRHERATKASRALHG